MRLGQNRVAGFDAFATACFDDVHDKILLVPMSCSSQQPCKHLTL